MSLVDTIYGKIASPLPIWLMRQAGRYLPEYQKLRATSPSFIAHCLNADKASTTTLQPIQRFDFDGAIIFSDILLVPWAMGQPLDFIDGSGPVLTPLAHPSNIILKAKDDIRQKLNPVAKAITKTRAQLDKNKALIGFCGGAWTLACYMLEGKTSRDFSRARHMLWQDQKACFALLELLADVSADFLAMQAEAGADVLMIFDSWAGIAPSLLKDKLVIAPTRRIIAKLRDKGIKAPVIAFPKGFSDGGGEGFATYVKETQCQVLAIDHTVDCEAVHANLPANIPVQGNLDPMALLAGGEALKGAVAKILLAFRDRPHIFNLGHGIDPKTPIAHVHDLIAHVRNTNR